MTKQEAYNIAVFKSEYFTRAKLAGHPCDKGFWRIVAEALYRDINGSCRVKKPRRIKGVQEAKENENRVV